jgi:hypothetical protein
LLAPVISAQRCSIRMSIIVFSIETGLSRSLLELVRLAPKHHVNGCHPISPARL